MNIDTLQNILPWGRGVQVLKYYDCGLIAVDKPEGVKTHPNSDEWKKCLMTVPYDLGKEEYALEEPVEGYADKVHVLHRLDAPTSGVLLVSLSEETAALAKKAFKSRKVIKHYYALIKGEMEFEEDLWEDPLHKTRNQNKIRMHKGDNPDSMVARTEVELIKELDGLSLIRMTPITGFTHQLRIQCALRGHPIVGDKTYGDFRWSRAIQKELGIKSLCLHAKDIILNTPGLSFDCSSQIHPTWLDL